MNIHEKAKTMSSRASSLFKRLAVVDPDLKKKAYMVLSSRFGQCNLTTEIIGIIKEFHKALGPDETVKEIKDLLKEKAEAAKEGKTTSGLDAELSELILQLDFKDDVNVELRYNPGTLDYHLIQKIYESSFIDKTHTKSPLAPVLLRVNEVKGN